MKAAAACWARRGGGVAGILSPQLADKQAARPVPSRPFLPLHLAGAGRRDVSPLAAFHNLVLGRGSAGLRLPALGLSGELMVSGVGGW